ncbi:hypothetical protein TEQG_08481 [Trichophyton equinum CBS 127.97]|uniref:Uncharacterized protein n=1 Tax=Trichophyton equinum (strain ATCC MYA-4606 / CBS 127.97) TaxID=559882 RepID=F2Q5X0_TRIEC|nr:hypothetical protein TEQG_08481 [Trichophyton equinum CBS 127.97]
MSPQSATRAGRASWSKGWAVWVKQLVLYPYLGRVAVPWEKREGLQGYVDFSLFSRYGFLALPPPNTEYMSDYPKVAVLLPGLDRDSKHALHIRYERYTHCVMLATSGSTRKPGFSAVCTK